ncbi:hypothetical protein B566_EDAN015099 [Ephemera danica]|nr:hypothetical protein B566_EDAN015099 [Ephemera danica]
MTKKAKKSSIEGSVCNSHGLKEFVVQESRFISDLMDRLPIPTLSEDPNDGGRKVDRARSLEELMSKLEGLQGKKLNYKNKLVKKGLKNKLKKKKKNEERILNKKLVRAQKTSDIKQDLPETEKKLVKPAKPVFNSEGKLVFSKFDFSEIGRKDKDKKEERDPKKILKQMEKQKEKIEMLESAGATDRLREMKEKQAWALALKKSQGVKVKDDPNLLKKTIKKVEQRKKQSAKKWKSREDSLKKQQDDRQKKRSDSIKQRKDRNKQNKLKKAIKKGRVMPGF